MVGKMVRQAMFHLGRRKFCTPWLASTRKYGGNRVGAVRTVDLKKKGPEKEKSVKTAAVIITVGATVDPILKAIEESRSQAEAVTVCLLYGRAFPGQKPSPFEIAGEAKQKCEELAVAARVHEVADPEDIDVSLDESRRIFSEIGDVDRVIVNFTGGTKVLSAAVVHAALTAALSGELVLDYTGGPVRDGQGRVVRDAMRLVRSERTATDERLQQVLKAARQSSYREARVLSRWLPAHGRAGFVKRAVEALYLWDEFDYEAAATNVRSLQGPAGALRDDAVSGPLARFLVAFLEPSNRLAQLLRGLRKAQQGDSLDQGAHEDLPLLVADVLENSHRRLEEERPTDSVVRSYRAVESAVQAQLLRKGVNPWRPRWDTIAADTRRLYLELLGAAREPKNLALSAGITLLDALGQPLSEEARKHLEDLQQLRNLSHVEHGYQRLDMNDARRLHEYAGAICEEVLKKPLRELRASVRHQWDYFGGAL